MFVDQQSSSPMLFSSTNELVLFYVDHTVHFSRNTGIQRCVRSLSRALLEQGVRLQPVVWNRPNKTLVPAPLIALEHLAKWSGPEPKQWSVSVTSSIDDAACWLVIVELVSGPHNPSTCELIAESKRHALKIAWMFHDAIPVRCSSLYGSLANAAASAHSIYMSGLAQYELVLANSFTSAEHLQKFWSEKQISPQAQLAVVPLADEIPAQERLPRAKNDVSIVLCVCSLEPRKNHVALLKAFTWLVFHNIWPANLTLVLVGWPNDKHVVGQVERAIEIGLPLLWDSNVDDVRLRELYQTALFSIYPSLEEGFGLPVAESLWHRRPCLCSGEGALGELASSGGCFTVNTRYWKNISRGLNLLISDEDLRLRLLDQIDNRKMRRWHDVASDWRNYLNINGEQH